MTLQDDLEATQAALKAVSADLQKQPTTEQRVAALEAELLALRANLPAKPPGPGIPDQWDSTGRLISADYLNAV